MRTVLLLAIVVWPIVARSEDVAGITEDELLARVSADPRAARVAAAEAAARAEVVATATRANPSIGFEREEVFPGGSVATTYVRVGLPIEISGRRGHRIEAARADVTAATADGESDRFQLAIDALVAFRTASYERARVELLGSERSALTSAVEVVRKRTAAGAASGYDSQRIQLELAGYDDAVLEAATRLDAARRTLGLLAGVAAGLDATEALDLPALPAESADLLGELDQRADMRAATARRASADATERAADRAWIPDLTVGAGVMRQDVSVDNPAWGYTAALSFTLPVFDHGQGDRARARAAARRADADRAWIQRTVPATVEARLVALAGTINRTEAIERDQVAVLAQLLRTAEAAYRDGGGNIVELLDAYTTARAVRLRALDSRHAARLAELELWRALGRRP